MSSHFAPHQALPPSPPAPPQPSIQALVASGIQEVPPEFIRPPGHRPDHTLAATAALDAIIPVLDMHELEAPERRSLALQQLATACEEWGIFQIINHGMDEECIQKLRDVTKAFFQLPSDVKERWAMKPGAFLGYGRNFNPSLSPVADWVDYISEFVAPEALQEVSTMPTEPTSHSEIRAAFAEQAKAFILRLSSAICESLGLPPGYIENTCGEFTMGLRRNYYPPCPQPDRVLGLAPHTDAGLFSVLTEGGASGLQVRKDGGEWVTVVASPNAVIVNLGDMLQVLSNGRYKSVEHRAAVNGSKERYSTVAYYTPSMEGDVVIGPAAELVREGGAPAMYRATTYLSFLQAVTKKQNGDGDECSSSSSSSPSLHHLLLSNTTTKQPSFPLFIASISNPGILPQPMVTLTQPTA